MRAAEPEAAQSALAYAGAFGFEREEKRAISKLVRIHSDADEVADAVKWQEVLVKRWPGDRDLILSLAHHSCLAGRAHEAEELLRKR